METLLADCLELITQARILAAKVVYDEMLEKVEGLADDGAKEAAEELMRPHRAEFDVMCQRFEEGQRIVETVLNQKREESSTAVPPAAGPAGPPDVPPEEEEDGGAEPGESSPVEGMEGWKLGAEYYGVQTHYKYDDEGLISVHIQGNEQELPVFEQMAVINEVPIRLQ